MSMGVTPASIPGNGSSAGWPVMSPPPSVQLDQVASAIAAIEGACSRDQWHEQNPTEFRAIRAYVRVHLAALEYIEAGADAGYFNLTDGQREKLAELIERADELVDTLGWAADAPDELAEAAEQERCA